MALDKSHKLSKLPLPGMALGFSEHLGTMETNIKVLMDLWPGGPFLLSSSPAHQIPHHREALILVTMSPSQILR